MAQLISQCLYVQISHLETSHLTSQRIRDGSSTATISYGATWGNNKRLQTFNYYHNVFHPRRLSNPISNSVNMNYHGTKNEVSHLLKKSLMENVFFCAVYLVSKYAIKTRKRQKPTEQEE